MPKIQRYGIKFPITIKGEWKQMVDTNNNEVESVTSQMMHLLFTPKGQRLRDPEFGTNLIRYIFNPNDNETWGDIISEINDAVSSNIPNCKINDIQIAENDDGTEIFARIVFSVSGEKYEVITKL